jgi:hypothetical protein
MPPDGALRRESSPTTGSTPCTCRANFFRPSTKPLRHAPSISAAQFLSRSSATRDRCLGRSAEDEHVLADHDTQEVNKKNMREW